MELKSISIGCRLVLAGSCVSSSQPIHDSQGGAAIGQLEGCHGQYRQTQGAIGQLEGCHGSTGKLRVQ